MSANLKPKILAIDTSSDVCSVALTGFGRIKEETVLAAREHTQRVLPMIDTILSQSDIDLKDLDAIAVANGPGSFTGLRIGLSIAQGLSYGAGLPLVPVSTLEAMANSVVRNQNVSDEHIIIPAIDARMDEIYWSSYRLSEDDIVQPIDQEHVSSPTDCHRYCQSLESDKIIAVGSGWRYSTSDSQTLFKANTAFYSTAYDIAELAIGAFTLGKVIDPMNAQATYLRNEITWQKRQRIRS